MECKLGYGFGVGACIQWLLVVEILLVCLLSHSLLSLQEINCFYHASVH